MNKLLANIKMKAKKILRKNKNLQKFEINVNCYLSYNDFAEELAGFFKNLC